MADSVDRPKTKGQSAPGRQVCKGQVMLRLFISGSNPYIESSVDKLRRELDDTLHGEYELTVHDVVLEPQLAEDEKILATPTLVREFPPPSRRIIGEFSSMEMIRKYFDLP